MKTINKCLLFSGLLSLICLSSCKGETPYIGSNGNWWVGEEDTSINAQGPEGPKGESVVVTSVEKIDSHENIDTYTITFSDGTKTSFTVKNGETGKDLTVISIEKTSTIDTIDIYTITFSDGNCYSFKITNGKDGECVYISSIEKTNSEGLVDSYTIKLSDGSEFSFSVTNGQDGLTPYIGPNGNWWIGDNDTGEFASYNYETRKITDGLIFTPMTINGKGGLVVTDFDPNIAFGKENYDLLRDNPEMYASIYGIINIPDYIGTTPVIGIESDVFSGNGYIGEVSLSKNTVYLGTNVFKGCTNLEKLDFNDCKLENIPNYAFYNASLNTVELPKNIKTLGEYSFANNNIRSIELPDSLEKLGNYSLYENLIKDIDLNNVKYIGDYSLSGIYGKPVYISKNVEYVGTESLEGVYVYTEYEVLPKTWGENIAGRDEEYNKITLNCLKNNEYIYSKTSSEVTIYDYIGDNYQLDVADMIDGLPVTKIGYGFNSITNEGMNYGNNYELLGDDYYYQSIRRLEKIIIPNSVKEIEYGAFYNSLYSIIYIPSSVEKISSAIFDLSELSSYNILFESNSLPMFTNENGSFIDSEDLYEMELYGFIKKGVSKSDIYYDQETKSYYIQDSYGLSLMRYLNLEADNIVIKSYVNNQIVHTILGCAVFRIEGSKKVVIEDGIKKIESGAFAENDEFIYIYIPSSVVTIYAEAFSYNRCERIYTSHPNKPATWDSLWYESSSDYSITYNCNLDEIPLISSDKKYEYKLLDDGSVSLVKYLGSSYDTAIKIPRAIDGNIVSKISSNCFELESPSTVYIYIPETVTILEESAFYRSYYNYKTYLYFETESSLPGFDSYYINTSSSYITVYWNRDIGY